MAACIQGTDGGTRAYNTRGGFFNQVSPARTVFEGGPGAWELVGRFSYIDLDDGPIQGGRFWRATPMVNWYLSDQLRLEIAYGYGMLDRFSVGGATHFFQTRLRYSFDSAVSMVNYPMVNDQFNWQLPMLNCLLPIAR